MTGEAPLIELLRSMCARMEAACTAQDRTNASMVRANELLDEGSAALCEEIARRKVIEAALRVDIKCLAAKQRELERQISALNDGRHAS